MYETAKVLRFVRFVMCCFITTVPVAFYWACSDKTVHYKFKMANFCTGHTSCIMLQNPAVLVQHVQRWSNCAILF